jgi:hypothetical protein
MAGGPRPKRSTSAAPGHGRPSPPAGAALGSGRSCDRGADSAWKVSPESRGSDGPPCAILGGQLDLIAFDEPFYYANFYDGENACGWTVEEAARGAGEFVQQVRQMYPQVVVGDIEPLTGPGTAAAYSEWLETYAAVNGEELAFLHIDVDWSSSAWPENLLAVQAEGSAGGVPIGVIYNGNAQDPDDQTWLAIAGERVSATIAGRRPADHVIFQSWNVHPDQALPEHPLHLDGFHPHVFPGPGVARLSSGRAKPAWLTGPARVALHQGNEASWR